MWQVNNNIIKVILTYKCIPTVIFPLNTDYHKKMNDFEFNKLKSILNDCSGVIFQGGDNYYKYDLQIMKYVYDKDIPTLGICLGMQTMAILFNGNLDKIKPEKLKHSQKGKEYVHLVYLNNNSRLYEILGEDTIKVNSRHNDCVIKTDLFISGYSSDDIIESIEDKNKNFFIGVQWHPEDMFEYDIVNKKLFDSFFKVVKSYYESRIIK